MPSCRHRDSLVGFRRILFMVRASGIHCTNRQLSDYFVDISKGNRTACVVTGFWGPGTTSGVQPVANRQGTHLHLRSHRPVFFTATQGIGGGRSGRRIAMQPQVKNQRNSWSCGLASYHAVLRAFRCYTGYFPEPLPGYACKPAPHNGGRSSRPSYVNRGINGPEQPVQQCTGNHASDRKSVV